MLNNDPEKGSMKEAIQAHAVDYLESTLAEASRYAHVADRALFLGIVATTLAKATHHMLEQEAKPGRADEWVRTQVEGLGPLLSNGSPRTYSIQVTIR